MPYSCCFWRTAPGDLGPENAKSIEVFLREEFHAVTFLVRLRREINAIEMSVLGGRISLESVEGRLARIGYVTRELTAGNVAALCCQMVRGSFYINMPFLPNSHLCPRSCSVTTAGRVRWPVTTIVTLLLCLLAPPAVAANCPVHDLVPQKTTATPRSNANA